MREDDNGTSNLIAFPGRSAGAARDDASSVTPRDQDLIRRLEAIAGAIGVPVATFLGAAQARAAAPQPTPQPNESDAARPSETDELLRLFGRISDGRTRDQCLALLRMLAASEPEAGRSR